MSRRSIGFERDPQAEVDRLFPGQQLVRVTGIRIEPRSGQTVYLKDIKFSDSITIEHNTLGDGAIGHIVRNRTIAPDTAVSEGKWRHSDQGCNRWADRCARLGTSRPDNTVSGGTIPPYCGEDRNDA